MLMKRTLPPLNALKCFEAAGRLGSMTRAADELSVTHGAVSRQVRMLEDWLGLPLFRRYPRRIELTDAGARYHARITSGFDVIAAATDAERQARAGEPIRLTLPPTFAMRWLLPKLPSFNQRHPDIPITFQTTSDPVETMIGAFGIAIRRADMRLPGFEATAFLPEYGLPVISPALQAQKPIGTPRDLAEHTLVHTNSLPDLWPRWMERAGVEIDFDAGLSLDGLFFSIQAAIDGLGVAIGPLELVADELKAGRLITPISEPKLEIGAFQVLTPISLSRRDPILIFRDWLIETAKEHETHPC